MLLDNSLNRDIRKSVKQHVIMSIPVTNDDVSDSNPCRFSNQTPKFGTNAYLRVFEPVTDVAPRPDRIMQDIKKIIHACKEIHEAKGAYVPGLAGGCVPGHRHTAMSQKTSSNYGGKRTHLEYDPTVLEKTLHEDLIAILNESHGTANNFRLIEESDNELDELFGEQRHLHKT